MAESSWTGRPQPDMGARLAAHLRSMREQRGLSRAQVADAAGISVRTLERIERATSAGPGLSAIAALAHALGATLDELIARARNGTAPGLVSAGYEGRGIEEFVRALADCGVSTVADVRLNAISRKAGFSKRRLAAALDAAGIEYRHLPDLGNPKDNRPPFWQGRVAEGQAVYRRLLDRAPARQALEELFALASRRTVAVMCFERDETRCHRKVICDLARTGHGLPVAPLAAS